MISLPPTTMASPFAKQGKAKPYQYSHVSKANPAQPHFGATIAVDVGGGGKVDTATYSESVKQIEKRYNNPIFSNIKWDDPWQEYNYHYRAAISQVRTPDSKVIKDDMRRYEYLRTTYTTIPELLKEKYRQGWTVRETGFFDGPKDLKAYLNFMAEQVVTSIKKSKGNLGGETINTIAIAWPATVQNGNITQCDNLAQTTGLQWAGMSPEKFNSHFIPILKKHLRQNSLSQLLPENPDTLFFNDGVAAAASIATVGSSKEKLLLMAGTGLTMVRIERLSDNTTFRILPTDLGRMAISSYDPTTNKTAYYNRKFSDKLYRQIRRNDDSPKIRLQDVFSFAGFIKQAKRHPDLKDWANALQNEQKIPQELFQLAFKKEDSKQTKAAREILDKGFHELAVSMTPIVSETGSAKAFFLSGGIFNMIDNVYQKTFDREIRAPGFHYCNERLKYEINANSDPDIKGRTFFNRSPLLDNLAGLIKLTLRNGPTFIVKQEAASDAENTYRQPIKWEVLPPKPQEFEVTA